MSENSQFEETRLVCSSAVPFSICHSATRNGLKIFASPSSAKNLRIVSGVFEANVRGIEKPAICAARN